MTDVSVQEIIAAFKEVKREDTLSLSNDEKDYFLDLMRKKSHWTLQEYKDFFHAYSLEYLHTLIRDSITIYPIKKKYNFKLDWNDYFNVLDNVKGIRKQKQYINYYFWYRYADMNETFYKQLINKPYFKLVSPKTRISFLTYIINTDDSITWLNNYFTDDEIRTALKKHQFTINFYNKENEQKTHQEQEKDVRNFYKRYENLMSKKAKVKLFHEAVKTGSLPLIKFLYQEKNIRKLNKVALLWHVCADTAYGNTLEVLNCLKDLGMRFTPKDLQNSQEHNQWGYMEHKEELLLFFKQLEAKKNYDKLNKKLTKKNKNVLQKVSKV